MIIASYTKEPASVTDYEIDWTGWLAGRTITTSTWTIDPVTGITVVDDSNTSTITTLRLSDGTWQETYIATNHIIASDTEEEEKSIQITIQQEQKYCTSTEVRRRATQSTDTALPPAELDALIEQASRFFDLACAVDAGYFNPPAYPFVTEMIIYGQGTSYLRLPPYVPGSLDTTITVPTNYTAPTFIEKDGYLILTDTNGLVPQGQWRYPPYTIGWWEGVPVTLSAIWGFPETPEDVKLAVIELTINLWRETDPAQVKLVDLQGQPLRERMPPRVAEIAKRYRPKVGMAFA